MTRARWQILCLLAVLALIVGVVAVNQRPSTPEAANASPSEPIAGNVDPLPWTAVDWRLAANPFPAADPRPVRIDGLAQGPGVVVGWGRVEAKGRNEFDDMGAVFVSSDGIAWRSIALDHGVPPNDTSEPYGVGIGPLGLIAHGGVCCGRGELALWQSVDGLRWTRVPVAGDLDPRSAVINRVVGTRAGWVAVGRDRDSAAIWSSRDGQTWHAVDPAQAGLRKGVVSDVALVGQRLIAVGTVDDPAATHDGAVWTSDDGLTWSRIAAADPTLTGPDETELWRVVPFANGLFVAGNHGSHEDRVRCEQLLGAIASVADTGPPETGLSCGWGREHHWLSLDGSAWHRLPPLDPLPGQPAAAGIRPIEFRLLLAGGPDLLTVGEDTRPPDGDVGVWVTADGATWRALAPVGRVVPASGQAGVALLGRRIVAVNDRGARAAAGANIEIWIGTIR